jgi:RimJ/RimL family protein N-acetyltransferase
MVERAIGWFAERDIHRVELQVVTANRHAHDVYAHMGWRDELTQMVFQR